MTLKFHRNWVVSVAASSAFLLLAAPGVNAQCVARAGKGVTLAPELRSLQDPAAMDQESSSVQAGSPQVQDQDQDKDGKNRDVSILGFWKKLEETGGVVTDVGFQQFNAGGTELLNDTVPPDGGNNFCMGGWERIGRWTYAVVHTFLIFDTSGKKPIAVAIERSHITVGRDGNTFTGKWNQDSYDFSGNVIANTHSEGTLSGSRIAPGLQFPFPFPL